MDFEGIAEILVNYKNDKIQQKLGVLLHEAQYMSLVWGIRGQYPKTITIVRYTVPKWPKAPNQL